MNSQPLAVNVVQYLNPKGDQKSDGKKKGCGKKKDKARKRNANNPSNDTGEGEKESKKEVNFP